MAPGLDADWLGASRRAADAVARLLAERPGTPERVTETGSRGEGGDRTLVIDADAEALILAELDGLHAAGARFTAVSEERGEVGFGSRETLVIIDPLDGSTNAKRGLGPHAVSIAVADGPTMADVAFGFVRDLAAREEFVARRAEGAWLDGARLDPARPERRSRDGRLELLGVEAADPRLLLEAGPGLRDAAYRVRALGAMAVTLCQVAAARLDGMVTLRRCRAVDVAAGQLIVREAGGLVAFPGCAEPLGAPLGLEAHSPLVAARTPASLDALRTVVRA